MNDAFADIGVADEKQLRLLVRDWRRGRADRNLIQALQDAYIMVFAVVLIGAMLVNSILQAQSDISSCDTSQCLAARGLLPWATVAGSLAFALVASRMFGPIIASAAEGFWFMASPMDRRRLLAGRLIAAVIVAAVVGAAAGALVAALTGSTLEHVGIWALAAGLGVFGLTALAAAEQGSDRQWVLRALQALAGLSAVAALVGLVGISAGWFPVAALEQLSIEFAYVVAALGLLLGLISVVVAYLRLRSIRRQALTSGSQLLAGMQGAAFALDFALVRDIMVEHEAKKRGHVRATRGRGYGTSALVLRDVQRLLRRPQPLLLWLASMLVPYAVEGLGIAVLSAPVSAFVLMIALIGFFNSLRVLTRTKGLQRCFPFAPAQIRTAAMVVPGVLSLVWVIAVTPAFLGWFAEPVPPFQGATTALIAGLAGFLAAVRWVSAKPADYSGPMVAVGMGAMPPGMMFSFLRGIDIVAIITLPVVFNLPVWISLVIAVIVFSVLRTGFDTQAIMEQSEEQRKQLEEAKAAAKGGQAGPVKKTKVRRRS